MSDEMTPAIVMNPRHSLPYKESNVLTSAPVSREGLRSRSAQKRREVRSGGSSRAENMRLKVELPGLRESYT